MIFTVLLSKFLLRTVGLIDADALIERMESDAEQMEEPLAKMFTYADINDVKHSESVIKEEDGDAE